MDGRINVTGVLAKERPFSFMSATGLKHAAETDQIVRHVEVGVIHRDFFRILRTLIDQGVAAVTEVRTHKGAVRFKKNGSVILGAADAEGFIDRMNRNTLELGRRKSLGIDIFPFLSAFRRGPDS